MTLPLMRGSATLCRGWGGSSFRHSRESDQSCFSLLRQRRYSTGTLSGCSSSSSSILLPEIPHSADKDEQTFRLLDALCDGRSQGCAENLERAEATASTATTTCLHSSLCEDANPRPLERTVVAAAKGGSPWESIDRKKRARKRRQSRVLRRPRKLVVVGDMHTGKTALVSAYCKDRFPEMYMPTILRCEDSEAKLQGVTINLIVLDTPGRHDYQALRKCAYRKADLVIICCALDCPKSLENVEKFWVPEVCSLAKGVPYMIVGTRADEREAILTGLSPWPCSDTESATSAVDYPCFENEQRDNSHVCAPVVSTMKGREISQRVGAQEYFECSARYRDGTRTVFEQATLVALRKHRRKRKLTSSDPDTCTIL